MPTISLRCSEEEYAAWREAAGGPRDLSKWIRLCANAAVESPEAARSSGMASGSGGLQSREEAE